MCWDFGSCGITWVARMSWKQAEMALFTDGPAYAFEEEPCAPGFVIYEVRMLAWPQVTCQSSHLTLGWCDLFPVFPVRRAQSGQWINPVITQANCFSFLHTWRMRRRSFIILWLHVLGDTNGTEVVLVNMQKYRHTSLYKLKVLWQPCVKQTWCCHFSSSVCSLPISVSHFGMQWACVHPGPLQILAIFYLFFFFLYLLWWPVISDYDLQKGQMMVSIFSNKALLN